MLITFSFWTKRRKRRGKKWKLPPSSHLSHSLSLSAHLKYKFSIKTGLEYHIFLNEDVVLLLMPHCLCNVAVNGRKQNRQIQHFTWSCAWTVWTCPCVWTGGRWCWSAHWPCPPSRSSPSSAVQRGGRGPGAWIHGSTPLWRSARTASLCPSPYGWYLTDGDVNSWLKGLQKHSFNQRPCTCSVWSSLFMQYTNIHKNIMGIHLNRWWCYR